MSPKTGNKLPDDHGQAYAAAIADALRSELGDGHRAAKTVMRWTGASDKSARNWLSGMRGPSGSHLMLLARESDAVALAMLTLTGRQSLRVGQQMLVLRDVLSATVQALDEAISSGSID